MVALRNTAKCYISKFFGTTIYYAYQQASQEVVLTFLLAADAHEMQKGMCPGKSWWTCEGQAEPVSANQNAHS